MPNTSKQSTACLKRKVDMQLCINKCFKLMDEDIMPQAKSMTFQNYELLNTVMMELRRLKIDD